MDTGGTIALLLVLLGLGYLSVATLRTTLRGGPGPGDPPASHPRVDPAGFPVLARPRGAFDRGGQRRSRRARTDAVAAAIHTARERATARRTSAVPGGRPSPSGGRSSTRLP